MEILLIGALLAIIPAGIAQAKGRSFAIFWLYGFLLFPVALIHAFVMRRDLIGLESRALTDGLHRRCPFCAEVVKAAAVVCRFCGRDLPPVPDVNDQSSADAVRHVVETKRQQSEKF